MGLIKLFKEKCPEEEMEVVKGIEAYNKALWLPKQKILVIADLHIGYEEALNKRGILVPRSQFEELKREITELLNRFKPKTIVINGDLKHEFGEISTQEWVDTTEILDLLLKRAKVMLVKGNHDTILKPIAKKKGLEIADFYCTGNICIMHGDKIRIERQVNDSNILIIAHEHPAVSLREGAKTELYKCFLLGRWKNKKLIVMPSLFSVFEGSDVKRETLLSPYLKNIENFEVFIIGDKIYRFGNVKGVD